MCNIFTTRPIALGIGIGIGAALILSCASPALGMTKIRTAAQDASEPKFVVLYESGKSAVGGICVDIMRAIERVDPTLKFVGDQTWQPLLRIEAGVSNGHLDACCGLLRTKPREAKYVYIDPPFFPCITTS